MDMASDGSQSVQALEPGRVSQRRLVLQQRREISMLWPTAFVNDGTMR